MTCKFWLPERNCAISSINMILVSNGFIVFEVKESYEHLDFSKYHSRSEQHYVSLKLELCKVKVGMYKCTRGIF